LLDFPLTTLALVSLTSLGAGFIDAIAGGGGLITTPTLLIFLPDLSIAQVLATTKCASIAGTTGAAITYVRRIPIQVSELVPPVLAAMLAAWFGARAVSHLDPQIMRPAIMALLILMAIYTLLRPNLGRLAKPDLPVVTHTGSFNFGLIVTGLLLGFYDGFFGPGTGSILVLILILFFGRDFLHASAMAKFINGASNIGALMWFLPAESAVWTLALPMAAGNLLGGVLGSRVAISAGNAWIRWIFLIVVTALIARLGYSLLPLHK
jgi:uncharacterized protein